MYHDEPFHIVQVEKLLMQIMFYYTQGVKKQFFLFYARMGHKRKIMKYNDEFESATHVTDQQKGDTTYHGFGNKITTAFSNLFAVFKYVRIHKKDQIPQKINFTRDYLLLTSIHPGLCLHGRPLF